jgi:hypothetical protein
VLDVMFGSEIVTVWFAAGDLVHASSNQPREGERLGDILVQRGLIERDELEWLLEESQSDGRRIGEILQDGDWVRHEDLAQALCHQIERIFQKLYRREEASYRYRDGLPQDFEEQIRLNATQLLLEGARRNDEEVERGEG